MSKEYIIHGTLEEQLVKILEDGYINNNPNKKLFIGLAHYDKKPKQIFTQLVYYDIPNQANVKPHWWNIAIVLDKKILKDYPFYATNVGEFKNNFNNGLINNDTNPKYDKKILVRGKGKLTQLPSLTKLKKQISKQLTKKVPSLMRQEQFEYSHEILFNKKISLDKYCIKLMLIGKKHHYDSKMIDKLIDLAKAKNIPLKFRDYKLRGNNEKPINNFINSIEKD